MCQQQQQSIDRYFIIIAVVVIEEDENKMPFVDRVHPVSSFHLFILYIDTIEFERQLIQLRCVQCH